MEAGERGTGTAGEARAEGPRGARATAALQAPFRVVGGLLFSLMVRVPLHAAGFALVLFLGAQVLRLSSGAQGLFASMGLWTVALALAVLGAVTGALAGGVSSAGQAADRLQAGLGEWLLALPAGPGAELVPPMRLDEARTRYEGVVDRMFDATVGRVPLPGSLRRLLRRPFRRAIVEDFLDDCGARGLTTVGYPELRNWMLARGIPFLMAPFRAQLRLWRAVSFGVPGLALAVTLGLALLAGRLAPATSVIAISGSLGLAVFVVGLVGSGNHAAPVRWRVGMASLAACIGLWPLAYLRIWPPEGSLLWFLVPVASVATLRWSLREAFLNADPPGATLP